ncbi:hypothetical protein AVEN_97714-1 [Araneus ventricosus]|uniref:Uncharacterized protein n=1 Tax=Araneus ventricosus TaxID=182803 RepID=A0A4Y2KK63_ARAVE|nr:hypothetical protein AVEN_97714-1 [Araneus ventricosus]
MANDFSPTATPEQLMPPLMRSIPGGHGIQSSRMLRGAGGDDVFTSGCRGFGVSESCQFLEQGNTSRFMPYTDETAKGTLLAFCWEVLNHPSHSPDLSPCDYRVWLVKEGTERLALHLQSSGVQCCGKVVSSSAFLTESMEKLAPRWDIYLNNYL